jgi:hypothetical protein
MRKYAGMCFADTGHLALLRLVCRFASEKLLNGANQGDAFYAVKYDISKIVAFKGAILNLKYVRGP